MNTLPLLLSIYAVQGVHGGNTIQMSSSQEPQRDHKLFKSRACVSPLVLFLETQAHLDAGYKIALKTSDFVFYLSIFKARRAVVVFPKNQDYAWLIFLASSTTPPLNSANRLSTVAAWEMTTTLRRNGSVLTLVTAQNAKEVSGKATRFTALMPNTPLFLFFLH